MDKLYDDLLVELECPICMSYMSPPIRQCATGHSVCESCRNKLPVCPICQERFTESKNLSLEALARKMHYPCTNNKSGCMARLTLEERESHERNCPFKGYKCAYSKCKWSGKYQDLLGHWIEKKLSSRPYRNTNVCHIKVQKSEAYYVNMIQAYNSLFWYKFKTTAGKLLWSVQYIGPNERANDYYFEIELFKPGQPIRRTLMSEYCQPVEIDNDILFKPGCCVSTTLDAVSPYFGDDDLLIYYMRVREMSDVPSGPSKDMEQSQGQNLNTDQSCSRESLTFNDPRRQYENQQGGMKANRGNRGGPNKRFYKKDNN